jgi:enoyl-CoA hydratase/carnithine racemase
MSDIITEESGRVLRVGLNRPDHKNAMTSAMYLELAEIFNDALWDDTIGVVLLHGEGADFCAGNDIGDFIAHPPADPADFPQGSLMKALIAFDKPVVAAVQGAAIGGGTTMLSHADVVLAGEGARFRTPFVDLALVPEFGSSFVLPLTLGRLAATELLLLGETIPAARAEALGLVTRVVPDADLTAAALTVAQTFAEKPPGALRAAKRLLKQGFLAQLKEAVGAENREFMARLRTPEAKEALSAFLEKRRPDFTRAANAAAAA